MDRQKAGEYSIYYLFNSAKNLKETDHGVIYSFFSDYYRLSPFIDSYTFALKKNFFLRRRHTGGTTAAITWGKR